MPKFDANNIMHKESLKAPMQLPSRLVLVWSVPHQRYIYNDASHPIINKIGRVSFDQQLASLVSTQDYKIDENFDREKGKNTLYYICTCYCGLC